MTSTIIYLHGFRSSPLSVKAQAMVRAVAARPAHERPALFVPDLGDRPAAAIRKVVDIVARERRPDATLAFVGSSLGGYYATHLAEKHGLRAVLVNPAVVAHLSLAEFVGTQTNLYTGEAFEFRPEYLDELRALEVPAISRPQDFLLLAETGDEVLDYRQAVARYAGARQTVLAGGDHSFTRWPEVLDQVIDFVNEHPV